MKHYDSIIHFIIEVVLGKYMSKYIVKDCCYPVVTGGSSVLNCIKPKVIKISDIDIVFVSTLHKLVITEDNRFRFLNDIMTDPELIEFCSKHGFPPLHIDKVYETKPEYKRMVTIKLARLCAGSHALIDTSIQHENNNRILGKYPIKKRADQPIPYYTTADGINWASCEYVKIDTVRILIHYTTSLNSETTQQNVLSLKRFVVYVKKLCHLLKIRDIPLETYIKKLKQNDTINVEDMNIIFNMLHKYKSFVSLKNKLLRHIPDAGREVLII